MSATLEIAAPSERIFEVLADLSRHADIDGSGTVLGAAVGPTRLFAGAEFTMGMQQLGRRYRSVSRVVDYDEGRSLAWESVGEWRGHRIVGGQRWRWTLTPLPGGGTAVQHTYLWGYARLPLLTIWLPGYPARAGRSLPRSLAKLAALLSRQAAGSASDQACADVPTPTRVVADRSPATDGPPPGARKAKR